MNNYVNTINEFYDFQNLLYKDIYEIHMGVKKKSNLIDIYKRYSKFVNEDFIKELINEENYYTSPGICNITKKAIIKEYFLFHVQIYKSKIAIQRAKEIINIQDKKLTLRKAQLLVLSESDRTLRKKLDVAIEQKFKNKINPIYNNMYEKVEEVSKRLGFRCYEEILYKFSDFDRNQHIEGMESILEETKYTYKKIMQEVLYKRGLDSEFLERHDLFNVWNTGEFPFEISIPDFLGKCISFLRDLGLDDVINRIDILINNNRLDRTSCFPLEVPNRIILFLNLKNRFDDYKMILHEIGHALHFSSISEDCEIEYRRWFDSSISEAYAFLFENLMVNSGFIGEIFGDSNKVNDYLKLTQFNRIFFIRLYVAKSLWEHKYSNDNDLSEESKLNYWGELFYRATGFYYSGTSANAEREFFFGALSYLEGWLLEYQLENCLESKFGDKWYSNLEAGAFLKKLWKDGRFEKASDLSEALGFEKPNYKDLINYINRLDV